MSDVIVLTEAECREKLARLEEELPSLAVAWNDPDWNHGDSCWMGHPDVDWDDRASEYDSLKFLVGDKRPSLDDDDD